MNFTEEMIEKIDNGIKLTEYEIRELIWESDAVHVDEQEGEKYRWQEEVKTIIEYNKRFFAVDWYRGLTENQENEYLKQPYEVVKNEYQKTITVTEWNRRAK